MYRDHLEQALQPLVDRLWHLEPHAGWDWQSLVDCLTWEDVLQVTLDSDDVLLIEDALGHATMGQYLSIILHGASSSAHTLMRDLAIKSLAEILLPLILDRCEHEESERQRELPEAAQSGIRAWVKP